MAAVCGQLFRDSRKTALKRARVIQGKGYPWLSQVKNGLPRDVALRLAAQTVFGSAKMTLQGDKLLSMRMGACLVEFLGGGFNQFI